MLDLIRLPSDSKNPDLHWIVLLVIAVCCALSFVFKTQNTKSLIIGTSIENIESQTQQDQLYSGVPIWVRKGGRNPKSRPFFEVMACLAITIEGTPSMVDEVFHTSAKNPDESCTGIRALLMSLSQDVKDVMGNVDSSRDEIKGKALENLEEENEFQDGRRIQERTTRKTASPKRDSARIQGRRKCETVGLKGTGCHEG